jgi:succinate dehydrogenase hydrophobic anchor subunit
MSASGETAPTAATTGRPAEEVRSWTWHVMAVSSWLLVVLLPIHLITTWIVHDPAHFGVALYVDRWHHGGWRLLDGSVVVLGLLHGGLGLNAILGAMTSRPLTRAAVSTVLVLVVGGIGLLALSTIFSFNVS